MPSVADKVIPPGYANGEPPGRAIDSAAGSGGTELGFDDLLDVINPLQHIPIVSYIYRQLTGDEIASPARIAGGFLFGGPIGFVVSLFDSVFAEATGDNLVGHAVAALDGEEADAPAILAEVAPADRGSAGASVGGHAAAAPKTTGGADDAAVALVRARPLHDGAALPGAAPDGVRASPSSPDAAGLSPEGFARRMMQALDKYEVLVRARQASRVDRTL